MDARPAASCSATHAALRAFIAAAPRAKRTFFLHHKKAADRRRYVAAQATRLRKLRSAYASCTPAPTPPPPAGCSPSIGQGSNTYLSEGGTIDAALHPKPVGPIHAAMIFVDFPDAPAASSPDSYWNLLAPGASWLGDESYGRLQLQITPTLKWFRMSKPAAAYGFRRGFSFDLQTDYIREAVALADPTVDFSGDTYVYVVAARTPDVNFSPAWIAPAGRAISADGAQLRWGATFGDDIWSNARWGWHVLAHETGHTFGLPDLYDFNFDPSNYQQQFDHAGGWSIMSWSEPAGESFAWEKFRLGWLDPAQLRCVGSGSETETLTPLETSGGLKAMVVTTGPTTADVIEVRKQTADDAGLCDQGVLVYRVDGAVASGHGPVELLTRGTGSDAAKIAQCSLHYDAPLDLRDGKQPAYEDAQVKVEVLTANPDGSYSVRVTKK